MLACSTLDLSPPGQASFSKYAIIFSECSISQEDLVILTGPFMGKYCPGRFQD